jgi:hypothetical protein
LIARGADPNLRDNFGRTPLGEAMREKDYLDKTQSKGEKIYGGNERIERNRAMIELLKKHGGTL